jgi:hypothetical protein
MISKISMMLDTGMMVIPCCGDTGIMYYTAAEMIYRNTIPTVWVRYKIRRFQ